MRPRDRGGVGIDDALRALDDWVERTERVTRIVELQAEAERKGPDDVRSARRR